MEQSPPVCDLYPYLEDIFDYGDRRLFEEACRAAAAGALRAAYIMLWLTCMEAIKRGFRELAGRDRSARTIAETIDEKEGQQQSVDCYLLEQAETYGFLGPSERDRLQHIYEGRCVYVGPYPEPPGLEELRSVAESVCEIVLHRPLNRHRRFVLSQVESLTTDPAFLPDSRLSVEAYAESIPFRFHETLGPLFIEKLWEATEALALDPSEGIYLRRNIWFSRAVLGLLDDFDFRRLDLAGGLRRYPIVASHALSAPEHFRRLQLEARNVVVEGLIEYAQPLPLGLARVQRLDDEGMLTDRDRELLSAAVADLPIAALTGSGLSLKYWARRAVAAMKARDSDIQDLVVAAVLRSGSGDIEVLPSGTQVELGRGVLRCAQGRAHAAEEFLADFARGKERWPVHFAEGMLLECFVSEQAKIRYKPPHALDALLGLRSLTPTHRRRVIADLIAAMQAGSPVANRNFDSKREAMLDIIGKAIETQGMPVEQLQTLRSIVEQLGVSASEDDDEDPFGDK